MIIKGNQRSGGHQMALHLLNTKENEHVHVHEVSGFVSNSITGALNEAYAVSKGTQCKQFMYSASFSPPENENVPIELFEKAIGRAEKRLDLEGQPRVIVFHEKEGRRHAHCVWSRIDVDQMKAVNIAHPKLKLNSLSKQIYLEQGWDLPDGFVNKKLNNPLNYTFTEWSQAKRTGQHPKAINAALQEAWAISDDRRSLEQAMNERGYFLARGDKAICVAVDHNGEVYSLERKTRVKKAEIEQRVGDLKTYLLLMKQKQKLIYASE